MQYVFCSPDQLSHTSNVVAAINLPRLYLDLDLGASLSRVYGRWIVSYTVNLLSPNPLCFPKERQGPIKTGSSVIPGFFLNEIEYNAELS